MGRPNHDAELAERRRRYWRRAPSIAKVQAIWAILIGLAAAACGVYALLAIPARADEDAVDSVLSEFARGVWPLSIAMVVFGLIAAAIGIRIWRRRHVDGPVPVGPVAVWLYAKAGPVVAPPSDADAAEMRPSHDRVVAFAGSDDPNHRLHAVQLAVQLEPELRSRVLEHLANDRSDVVREAAHAALLRAA